MHGDRVNYIYCDDHFAIYKNVELLHCILETNIMSYVNYIAIKKNYLQKKKVESFHAVSESEQN